MALTQDPALNSYRKIKVDPKNEVKMIGVLRTTGQPFKAVSRTEYYISRKQCNTLSKNKIDYTPL